MFSEINILIDRSGNSPDKEGFRSIFGQNPDFRNGNIMLFKSGNTRYFNNRNIHIYIVGEIYEGLDIIKNLNNIDEEVLLKNLPLINGSFLLFIFDDLSKKSFVVTDRINSRKLYYYKDSAKWILTNNPKYFSKIDKELNIGGIACYLINGVVLNNNTLYRNILVFDRACLHQINGDIKSRTYWHYTFTNEFKGIAKQELKKNFSELLLKSVSRRINAVKPNICYLSLSGGYDSRFLLGALRELKSDVQIRTFSYGSEIKRTTGDDTIAEKMSKSLGFTHEMIPAYLGDFVRTVEMNAEYGLGVSNFCDEADAWIQLKDQFEADSSSLLFVGDMYYMPGRDYKVINDKRIALYTSKIFPWYFLSPFLKYLPKEVTDKFINGYSSIFNGVLDRLPETNNFNDLKDFVYLDQRITHKLMVWRELFHSPFIRVGIPLLDNEILDFIRKLPIEYRHKKSLYIETIRDMFPDLFAYPMANNVWAYPSWYGESIRSYNDVYKQIISQDSKLDQIIAPDIINYLVESNGNFKVDKPGTVYRAIRRLSGKSDMVNNIFSGYLLRNNFINADFLITRLLLLKKALREEGSRQ